MNHSDLHPTLPPHIEGGQARTKSDIEQGVILWGCGSAAAVIIFVVIYVAFKVFGKFFA